MSHKQGGEASAANPENEGTITPFETRSGIDVPAILSDGIASGAFLGQALSQAIGCAFAQSNFDIGGTDNIHQGEFEQR